eukprot:g73979.t1
MINTNINMSVISGVPWICQVLVAMSDASVVSSSSLTDNDKESACSLDSHQKKILHSYSTASSVHAFDYNSVNY